MPDLRARLAQLLESGGPKLERLVPCEIAIYGAGNAGRALATAVTARGFRVHSFLDARASSIPDVEGTPCHLPNSEIARAAAAKGLPVVVAVFNFATDLRPILTVLRESGFERVITFYEMHEHLGLEPQFWLGNRGLYPARAPEILAGFDLFEDEESQRIYYDLIALRLTFETSLLGEPDQTNHYLPADLLPPHSPWRMIDGGAFTGDTIELLHRKGVDFEAVAAFEPDPANFVRLSEAMGKLNGQVRDIILFPCGLSNETGIRSFAAGDGAASALHAGGENRIQVVALDDVLPTFAPTFIKLDIEGAEPEALLGAQRMIARCKPILAVCVYHAPEHLWTLPALMRRLCPDHRLALRYHQFNGFDVVAYAFAR